MIALTGTVATQGETAIIPEDVLFEDRGNAFFEPTTASQKSKPRTYCKDVIGCGTRDYRSVGVDVTLNYLDGCKPRLNGVLSISGLYFNNATPEQFGEMGAWAVADMNGTDGFQTKSAEVCPEAPPIID
jgi:hypothetical protein